MQNKMPFEEFVKYLYIKDRKSGKIKKLTFSKREWEALHKFKELKERNYGTRVSKLHSS